MEGQPVLFATAEWDRKSGRRGLGHDWKTAFISIGLIGSIAGGVAVYKGQVEGSWQFAEIMEFVRHLEVRQQTTTDSGQRPPSGDHALTPLVPFSEIQQNAPESEKSASRDVGTPRLAPPPLPSAEKAEASPVNKPRKASVMSDAASFLGRVLDAAQPTSSKDLPTNPSRQLAAGNPPDLTLPDLPIENDESQKKSASSSSVKPEPPKPLPSPVVAPPPSTVPVKPVMPPPPSTLAPAVPAAPVMKDASSNAVNVAPPAPASVDVSVPLPPVDSGLPKTQPRGVASESKDAKQPVARSESIREPMDDYMDARRSPRAVTGAATPPAVVRPPVPERNESAPTRKVIPAPHSGRPISSTLAAPRKPNPSMGAEQTLPTQLKVTSRPVIASSRPYEAETDAERPAIDPLSPAQPAVGRGTATIIARAQPSSPRLTVRSTEIRISPEETKATTSSESPPATSVGTNVVAVSRPIGEVRARSGESKEPARSNAQLAAEQEVSADRANFSNVGPPRESFVPVRPSRRSNEVREVFVPVPNAAVTNRDGVRKVGAESDRSAVRVVSYDVESYVVLDGDTITSIAKSMYGSEAYAEALQRFNADRIQLGQQLSTGQRLRMPPASVLQRQSRWVADDRFSPGGDPALRQEASSRSAGSTTIASAGVIGRATSAEATTIVRSSPAVGSPTTVAEVRSPASSVVAATVGPTYQVQRRETLYAIAKQTLGDGRRWREIYDLNADKLDNEFEAPAGVVLRLPPGSSQVR